MKKLSLSIAVLLFATVTFSQTLSVDTQESIVNWTGAKVVGNSHKGTLKFKSGSLELKKGKLTGGTFIVDMTSLEDTDLTGGMKTKLEGHLKSDDFFGVETYPTAELKIKKVSKSMVVADLTIKGKTEEVEFEADVKTDKMGASATATLVFDRSKYDVRYGSGSFFDNLGDRAIKDDIELQVTLVAK